MELSAVDVETWMIARPVGSWWHAIDGWQRSTVSHLISNGWSHGAMGLNQPSQTLSGYPWMLQLRMNAESPSGIHLES